MLNLKVENALSWLLAIGSALVTCLVWSGSGTDPVNAPKLLVLGTVAFGVLSLIIKFGASVLWKNYRSLVIFIFLINLSIVSSTFFSKAPLVQNLYGAYGRNTGALTYFSLSIICLAAALLSKRSSHVRVLQAFFIAGLINVIYCFWVLGFGDPIPWNNTYKNILGLLGNPNFISAFLGMLLAATLAYLLAPKNRTSVRVSSSALILASTFLIYKAHATQGVFVALVSSALVIFFWIRSRTPSLMIQLGYVGAAVLGGLFALAGILQHGPLSFIYKKSVSLRGSYWRAGINMGQDHPFTGVGLDTYGDWYRSARPPVALIDTPGPTVLTNASHNVVIDIFSSGGWPLLVSYLAVMSLGLIAIFRLIKTRREYDVVAVGLSAVWVGYHVQSIVSINQIGLALWGWLLTGLLISYERLSREPMAEQFIENNSRKSKRNRAASQVVSPQLLIGLGLALGFIISIPPVSSDARWFTATQSRDIVKFKESLNSSYLNPMNSARLANAAMILQESNLLDDSREYALRGIAFNENYFESYLVLYLNPKASESEKAMAMENMKRLDPKNPDVLHYK